MFRPKIACLILFSLSTNAAWAFPKADFKTADGIQKVSILNEPEAAQLFEKMVDLKRVPYRYVNDGCWARAQRMAYRMSLLRVRAGKLFITGKLNPLPGLRWKFHVAPFILVGTREHYEVRVIDPSLFDKPVTVDDWVNASHPARFSLNYRSRGAYMPSDEFNPHISLKERIETGKYLRYYRKMLTN